MPAFLRLPAVLARYGVARATVYSWMADGRFPAAVSLGPRTVAWRVSDLEAWEASRATAHPARPACTAAQSAHLDACTTSGGR